MNLAEFMEQQQNGMRQLSVKHTNAFDQTDAKKFLFVYLTKATDKSRFTYYLNKRLETITDDKKTPFLEQIKVQSEIAQRKNNGLTATQTQWFDEYLQGFKATQQPTAQQVEQLHSQDEQRATFDTDKLKALFKSVFYEGDDYQRDQLTGKKQTRFDILCHRLEMILTDTDNEPTDKEIGGIAYMIYCSTYTITDYQKPKRTGQKGKFAQMIRTFFPIVGMSVPSDTHANKYQPNEELISLFGDILQYE